jgi:hypothetical protein
MVARDAATPARVGPPSARGMNEADMVLPANREAELSLMAICGCQPISEDMKAMRPSLLPGLLSAARRNMARGAAGLRLFEIGRRYLRGTMAERRAALPWCWRATRRCAAGLARPRRSTRCQGRGLALWPRPAGR